MRIIGGIFKGKKLHTPKDNSVRPTSDRLRENLFNILIHSDKPVKGALFLDLFSGTGAIGLEALSRGAAKTIFVEKHPNLLLSNIKALQLKQDQYHMLKQDVLALSSAPQIYKNQVDIVFMDPPFDHAQSLIESTIDRLLRNHWLKDDALIITEMPKAITPNLPETFSIFREFTAAASKIAMIKRTNANILS